MVGSKELVFGSELKATERIHNFMARSTVEPSGSSCGTTISLLLTPFMRGSLRFRSGTIVTITLWCGERCVHLYWSVAVAAEQGRTAKPFAGTLIRRLRKSR